MRPRLTPWLIGLVCVGPLGLAALLYYGPWDLRALPQLPGSRELVIPPRSCRRWCSPGRMLLARRARVRTDGP